jgi:endonuclease-3
VKSDQRSLARLLDVLEKLHGKPPVEPPRDALGLVVWENVAYLVDDEQRLAAFKAFAKRVGVDAKKIRAARPELLHELASMGGMHPAQRVQKLTAIADIVLDELDGDLDALLKGPLPQARRALKKFPGIGDPGADKILLFTGTEPVIALESNGLRTLLRLGFGEESKNYSTSYKSAQRALEPLIERTCKARIRAFQLLRAHGQSLCKNNGPDCDACPISEGCAFYARVG